MTASDRWPAGDARGGNPGAGGPHTHWPTKHDRPLTRRIWDMSQSRKHGLRIRIRNTDQVLKSWVRIRCMHECIRIPYPYLWGSHSEQRTRAKTANTENTEHGTANSRNGKQIRVGDEGRCRTELGVTRTKFGHFRRSETARRTTQLT